jgi:rRNA maturation endonuclease Nob1
VSGVDLAPVETVVDDVPVVVAWEWACVGCGHVRPSVPLSAADPGECPSCGGSHWVSPPAYRDRLWL